MHIRKGDTVIVISGNDKGARGRVLRVFADKGTAIVEGVNMRKKHMRPNPSKGIQGGVVAQESPIRVCKLLPVDPETGKPTRVGHKFLVGPDGKKRKVRIARRSGAELDR